MKTLVSSGVRLALACMLSLLLFQSAHSQQVAKSLVSSTGEFIGFYEYKPTTYSTSVKYPLIIFLHGIGERGNGTSELNRVLINAIPKYIAAGNTMTFTQAGKTETFLVLSPQLSNSYGEWSPFYVDEMIKYAKANLSIDTDRIILTGLSLGGGGAWRYISTSLSNASQIAALGPVCGNCVYYNNYCIPAQLNLPIWAFHGQMDGTVPWGCTQSAVDQINACGTTVAPLLTYYPTGGHGIWDLAYDVGHGLQNPNIYEWFLAQKRTKPSKINIPPVAAAGPDQTITLPLNTVNFDGNASYDPDGTFVYNSGYSFNWTKISGPATGDLVPTWNSLNTSATNLVAGVYKFQLDVVDANFVHSFDTVQVTVNPAGPPPPNVPPVAKAGADQMITLPVNTVNVSGSASTDPDGTISAYAWTKIAGPATFNIVNATGSVTAINNLVAGVYSFQLQVTDNNGATGKDTVVITVNPALPPPPPPNVPPVAKAGADQNITLPANSVNVDGSASTDPDGSITGYAWSKIAGPATFSIVSGSTAATTINNLVAGVYSFQLQVTDNNGATGKDTVVITVNPALPPPPPPNVPPVAKAGADQNITLPANSVNVDGSASTDPDGSITGYAWSKIAGPATFSIVSGSTAATTINNLVAGVYSFQLQVTDNNGATGKDTVVITVNPALPPPPPPNVPPVAKAGADQNITLPANSVNVDGSASTDPDGSITGYAWTKIAGPATFSIVSGSTAATTINNLVAGVYSFQLQVTDNNGATGKDTVVITVNPALPPPPPPNVPPVAKAGADQNITLPANSVNVDGSASTDPDGSITGYAWTKISGPASFNILSGGAASTTINNLLAGIYSFQLQVTDNNGAIGKDTIVITVNPAPPPPNQVPVALAGGNQTITLPANSVTIDGSGSNDPDGSISAFAWSKISGPASFNIVSPLSAITAINNLVAGVYSFQLQVTDNNGAFARDTITVTVNNLPPPVNQVPVAIAGTDFSITLPINSAALYGGASYDPDGTIAAYNWTKISGPTSLTIANASASSTAISNLVQGVYEFELAVTDNSGAVSKDSIIITVNAAPPPPPNQVPVAVAGLAQVITLPVNSVNLSGSGSYDPDGVISSFSWTQLSGPSTASIVSGSTAITAVNVLVAGTYSFQLLVTDDKGASATASVTVTVNAVTPPPNQAPIADAGNGQNITLPQNNVTLNGSASYDADGSIVNYNWVKISGPASYTLTPASGPIVQATGLTSGIYLFQLTVTDNLGASSQASVSITVNPKPIVPPVANAGEDFSITMADPVIHLDGSASYDPDGTIVQYSWNKISGPGATTIINSSTTTPSMYGAQPGVYVFELTVTDDDNATSTDRVRVVVLAAVNIKPIADAGKDSTIALSDGKATLNGSASSDPDGNIVLYSWRQITGNVCMIAKADAAVTEVSNLQEGTYAFELTVTDNVGESSLDTVKLTVTNNLRVANGFSIYPNPVRDMLTIDYTDNYTGKIRINIYDASGKLVRTIEDEKAGIFFKKQINLAGLHEGPYQFEIVVPGLKKPLLKQLLRM